MLSNQLKSLRLAKGLTQKELALALGLDYKRYNHYETGRSEPDIQTLNALADYFQVTTDYLLGRDEEEESPPSKDEGPYPIEKDLLLYLMLSMPKEMQGDLLAYLFQNKKLPIHFSTPGSRICNIMRKHDITPAKIADAEEIPVHDVVNMMRDITPPDRHIFRTLQRYASAEYIRGRWHESVCEDYDRADILGKLRIFQLNGVSDNMLQEFFSLLKGLGMSREEVYDLIREDNP